MRVMCITLCANDIKDYRLNIGCRLFLFEESKLAKNIPVTYLGLAVIVRQGQGYGPKDHICIKDVIFEKACGHQVLLKLFVL